MITKRFEKEEIGLRIKGSHIKLWATPRIGNVCIGHIPIIDASEIRLCDIHIKVFEALGCPVKVSEVIDGKYLVVYHGAKHGVRASIKVLRPYDLAVTSIAEAIREAVDEVFDAYEKLPEWDGPLYEAENENQTSK